MPLRRRIEGIMANRRNYGTGEVAALMALSQGTCYWPGCDEPVVRFVDKKPVVNLQIAHIRAANLGGARYEVDMLDEERNAFSNLILLCHPHHVVVDKIEPEKYSVELLFRWKYERESPRRENFSGLRNLTEDKLQAMIEYAVSARDERIEQAIARLEALDVEAASLLRGAVAELNEFREKGPILSEELVTMLDSAAYKLNLSEEIVASLENAANKLQLDHDVVAALERAANLLQGLPDMVEALHEAARNLRQSGEYF